ncbi:flagellar assembly protein FliW [Chitinilyticum piscinae]|uniref:Flagellar assembly factor FliW n=1 Tax=Chitinilyticum piscinae TaxID=2866724 RepID=A0A8J7K7W0_9NEIS|nr:flagellar assembly protein FliW [Chitinilyticum piscinae]MBE9608683.1 flagellar assembly protein FliW [Chitinilyticum piscinae]
MQQFSTPFGTIDVDPATVIDFPLGLPGFEQCHRFKLLHEERDAPTVYWLQSLDDAEVCFSVIEADRLGLNYQVKLSDEECALIALDDASQAQLLLMLARDDASDKVKALTQSPLVLNLQARKGMQKAGLRAQIVLTND